MEIYCHGVHKQPRHRLCGECREALAYAALRTDRFVYGDKNLLQCVQSAPLYKGEAGENPCGHALCRPQNAFDPSGAGAASCVGYTAVKSGAGREIIGKKLQVRSQYVS